MRAWPWLVTISIAGCGRLGFDALTSGSNIGGDGGGGASGDGIHATIPGDDGGGTDLVTCASRTIPALGLTEYNTFSGDLTATTPNDTGSCGGSDSEDVYTFTLADATELAIQANLSGTTAQTVLYLRTSCDDPASEIVCGTGKGGGASLYFDALPAGTYYLYVDADAPGHYNAQLTVPLRTGAGCSFSDVCVFGDSCVDGTDNAKCRNGGNVINQAFTGPGPFSTTATTSGPSGAASTCGGNDGGFASPEQLYTVALAAAVSDLHVTTIGAATTFDTIVYVRSDYDSGDIACNDDAASGGTTASDVHTGPLAAGTYFVYVDGFNGQSGTAQVAIDTTP